MLGWSPNTEIERGLERTIRYFRDAAATQRVKRASRRVPDTVGGLTAAVQQWTCSRSRTRRGFGNAKTVLSIPRDKLGFGGRPGRPLGGAEPAGALLEPENERKRLVGVRSRR